ncbi:TPA: phosphoglycerate kinase [Campylobacter fetus subsp. venerealis]|uniref:Phosphoglycerate kinase n=1 Tax=Campylobacter fetus subsp. venerealis NCTC 10354 TaxID=983328 RepID=A0AAE6IZV5_CAMFE|nr:phosphoglycerate kinase [Campylobacter fetus]OCS22612.1 phosphoglycerate kinase [Campylobacter fetus subsp. venerealis cfvi97/532]OCS26960.1 phosphoglycerate kinase [Campylobacter fetus subsp. venerealis cfvB10]OCS30094.1 phosphoglycerate kinase [Campylobacter fetus subsp. venerealis LMG 6570 = CCUG 33900]OCS43318.1 phosphoglycerate kinase [Campylobacter fetus subsp. venerealis cfvi02/298]AHE94754.1 phosphoglycerate kinase [Campylobacter fetus subsp. venerealis cfvi03/293]
MSEIISIKDINFKSGSKVFVRCDFNTPMDEFYNITDDRRIRSAIPTIRYILDQGCSVILASHLGRPKNGYEEKFSLLPVAKRLSRLIDREIIFANDVVGNDAKTKVAALKQGEVLLLENIRFEKGETKDDVALAKELSEYANYYVNDAFGVCHRAHSSVHAITKFYDEEHRAAGFLLIKEIEFARNLIKRPIRPFVAVVGGSKVSGKLQALTNLLPRVDKLIIGGGMAFTFLKAIGENIGNSLLEEDLIEEATNILKKGRELGVKIYLPVDVVVAQTFSAESAIKYVSTQEIPTGWMGLDIGPASVRLFREVLSDAQTIWWNGPMGVFEMDKFSKGSIKMSHAIAESFATTVVGGGDTADVVERAGDADEMTFISTGGGASLELIEGKELPGVKVLLKAES